MKQNEFERDDVEDGEQIICEMEKWAWEWRLCVVEKQKNSDDACGTYRSGVGETCILVCIHTQASTGIWHPRTNMNTLLLFYRNLYISPHQMSVCKCDKTLFFFKYHIKKKTKLHSKIM